MNILPPLLVFLICYLLGSFPTAYVIGKLNGINIFKVGSGNMGANNMTRALGLRWGVIVWAMDVCKGIVAVLVARRVIPWDELAASMVGAMAVVVGHNWSLLAALITGTIRGGKGAATAGGTWLMLIPAPIFVVTVGLWIFLVVSTRYVSLAVLIAFSIGTAWVMALITSKLIDPVYSVYVVPVTAMVYYRHRENIVALLRGRERRFMERVR